MRKTKQMRRKHIFNDSDYITYYVKTSSALKSKDEERIIHILKGMYLFHVSSWELTWFMGYG